MINKVARNVLIMKSIDREMSLSDILVSLTIVEFFVKKDLLNRYTCIENTLNIIKWRDIFNQTK